MTTDPRNAFSGLLNEDGIITGEELTSYAVDGVVPRVALLPQDVETVSRVLATAEEHELAVAPRGGGTKLALGNRPRRLDVVLGLTRLNRMLEHQPADLTATVQGGITLEALGRELEKEGQFFPLDSPFPAQATLGGTLATNTSGPRRLAYGTARDLVIGIKEVHAGGKVTKAGGKVVKNVTGYDLNKLYVGSLGTLGIIMEASLKLAPLPPMERTVMGLFPSVQGAVDAALEVLKQGVGPTAMCLLDASAIGHLRGVDLSLSGDGALLALELGGRRASVERRESDIGRLFIQQNASRVEGLEAAESRRVWRAINDLGWEQGEGEPTLMVRCGVLPTQVVELYSMVRDAFQGSGLALGMIAQVGHGIVRALAWPQDGVSTAQDISSLVERLRQRVMPIGSYAVVERCPVETKANLEVWGDPGEAIGIMRRLKHNFDPKGILNPGRFVGGI